MKKIFALLCITLSLAANSQLTSLIVRGDTLFNKDPLTGIETQLTKLVPSQSGQSGKFVSTNGTGYVWVDLQALIDAKEAAIAAGTTSQYYRGDKTWQTLNATAAGLGNVDNTSDANKPVSTAQQTALNLKANLASPTFTGTVVLPDNTVTNAMLAGSIDLATKVTGVVPFANGGIGGSAATSATTGTMTVNMTSEVITITPTGACTFNASGGVAGQRVTFLVTTSGTTSFTLTFGTNFKAVSTLATGTTTAKKFCVSFVYVGTTWTEFSRTAAM
jgi:hypothetical protein